MGGLLGVLAGNCEYLLAAQNTTAQMAATPIEHKN